MNQDKQDVLAGLFLTSGRTTPVCGSRHKCPAPRRCRGDRIAAGGFTLIEVMITCAIIAILSAIAYPSFADFVLRGKLVEPTNALSGIRASMEQYYQDNRTYANVSTTIISPCDTTLLLLPLKNFNVTCKLTTGPEAYTITATGSQPATTGFIYSITNANVQSSTVGAVWGATTCPTAWITKNGDACY
ncbi:MAG: prepilin-type N-terminal cleavage/methylation domain-containing protein [Herminiimonas sp.]|nr:prepilin-type N-terminal cleavage/methylation domain-containing protein [Herminiimonas sp.]